ncbi:unnamed protein product [Rotaria magnacalcarata]|uniref:Reverse transcriptase domain-containing protein n=1 Tax=Rotaria magnacalcarata TaxID=392030 RepID=A0A816NK76_9BILA|nr:unnamed protein product [Rotaria magnacalcarata]CAF1680076.1 unnamed protein product [Rotaria magnacalcarata]CAF2035721.1 unnamed protein product [Rotaria magnacalcarata]CAF3790639.1 unnamed protein product [Rotaria magnacalcarata]CAF3815407.1 unnamed protein product [Rotaria magnacalcarata]
MDANVSEQLSSQSRSIINPSLIQANQEKRRKKNHGIKKLQRFRRRRRARGMSEAVITKMIEARKREKEKQKSKQSKNLTNLSIVPEMNPMITTVSEIKQHVTNNNEMKRIESKNKRKRDISSFQLNGNLMPSISHGNLRPPVTKKNKRNVFNQCIPSNSISVNKQYPIPIYLTHSPHFIFQTLSQQFNRLLNKKDEQIFVHVRLQLLDRKYRLEADQRLWQSYLDLGLKEKLWPRSLYEIAKTDQFNLCENYIMTQLSMIDDQLDQCNNELDKQAQSTIPILLPSLENMDKDLTSYVSLHQNYLAKRIDQQIIRYKNEIHDQQLYQNLFTYNLTHIQRHVLEEIIHLRLTQLQVYQEFMMLEQRILYQFLPPNFDQFEKITAPDFYWPPISDHTLVDMRTTSRTILKQGKRTLLNIFYAAYEYKVDEQEDQYQQSLNQFELQSSTRDQINGMSLIDYFKAYMLHHTNQIISEIFKKLTYFRLNMSHRYQRSSSAKAVVGVSPEVAIDVLHCPYKTEELAHLSLGPSYIRSNQSALQPINHRETQIKNNLKDIKDKVKRQLTNYCKREPPIARMNQYSELVEDLLQQHYMAPLFYADRMRAQREFQLVQSIRRKAQRAKLIIRVCDKGGGLHIGSKIDYERKAAKYRDDTKAYQELSYNPLMEIFTNVTNAVNVLKNDKQLTLKNYNRLMPKRDDVRLSYMYFNPKPHKAGTPLRPIMNTIKAVTRPISDFLDELIRPIFDQYNKDNTIIDGVNLIKRLKQYATDGHLTKSTLFCTFDINNLYTMLPQDESIRILGDFLRQYVGERVQGISIKTIQKLAEIVLKENAFVYDHKFYKQIVGGAMGSPFTLTLANIFMWHWEKRWVRRQKSKNEIYGRYIDDVFFTSNEPIEVVQQLLKDANGWHPNIKLESNIGSSVPFLDILLTNNNGVLHTSVYHKPSAEPYVVPFLSDHPRYTFQNIIQTALVRAIRYSSTFEAFNHERRAIRLMLLFNGYPTTYIDKQFRKIFGNYITSNSILPLINNEDKFFRLRKEHMKQPTAQHSQVEARIAQFEQNNAEVLVEERIQMESSTAKICKSNKFQDRVIIHYTHEKRFTTIKKDMHAIFEKGFQGYGIEAVKLIVGHRNSPNSERELTRKQPPLKYLTLKQ